MLGNFVRTTWRNLLRYRVFSAINVFGLAISMSVCLLAIMLIVDAYNFDRFHPNTDRIYRVLTDAQRTNGGQEGYATTPYKIGETLATDFSGVEIWVPLVTALGGSLKSEEKELSVSGFYTETNFFEMFGFELTHGDPRSALSDPNSIVLTAETAARFFADSDPLGRILALGDDLQFRVTGVLAEFPGKTHLEFEALASLSSLPAVESRPENDRILESWTHYYSTYNFVRMAEDVDKASAEDALAKIAATAYEGRELETRDAGYQFYLQPLGEITPGPVLSNSMGRGLPEFMIWFLTVLCALVMVSACFNYASLTIARAFTRTREIGIRKVLGAKRWHVFAQFISEASIIALVAFVFAFGFLELIIPQFEKLSFFAFSDIDLAISGSILSQYIIFVLLVGFVAGLLPAFVFSRSRAAAVLKQLPNSTLFRRLGLRRALLVTQFSVSLLFVIILTLAWKQMNYVVKENFGTNQTDILNVTMEDLPYDRLIAEASQIPQFSAISATSHLMGTWQDSKVDFQLADGGDVFQIRDYYVDDQFIPNLGLELVGGENFEANLIQTEESSVIVNETFLKTYQINTVADALNATILLDDGKEVAIRGVLGDFLYKPLNYSLEPLLLRYSPEQWRVLNLRVQGDHSQATAALETIWKKLGATKAPQYAFYSDEVRQNFSNLQDLMWIVAYFGTIGIIIACLGLLGMAIYTAEARSKEMCIRRIVGADTKSLIILLAKGYFILLLVASVIAVPLGYILGTQLLQIFAYHISLDASIFLPGVVLLFVLGSLTTGSQIVKAAFSNPVETLKHP